MKRSKIIIARNRKYEFPQELPSDLNLRILGYEKIIESPPEILGFDAGEHPAGHLKDKF